MPLRIKRDVNEMKLTDLIHIMHLFTCLVFHIVLIFNVSQLSRRSTWCTASIPTCGWMGHPRFRNVGTWWPTSRAGECSASEGEVGGSHLTIRIEKESVF